MKAYGLPRRFDIEFPDKLDIWKYGRKSSIGKISGNKRSNHKNSVVKRQIRRYYKRKARYNGKQYINDQLN